MLEEQHRMEVLLGAVLFQNQLEKIVSSFLQLTTFRVEVDLPYTADRGIRLGKESILVTFMIKKTFKLKYALSYKSCTCFLMLIDLIIVLALNSNCLYSAFYLS